jgi:hypothetical protein
VPTYIALLAWLHVGLTLALTGLAVARMVRPGSPGAARGLEVATALLTAAALPLASAGGWWIDMPSSKMVPLVAALALGVGIFGTTRLFGRLAALALAAFFLTLGLASLRNGGPFTGFLGVKAILLGLLLALLVLRPALRLRMLAIALLLAGGAVLGLLGDVPAP